MVSTETPPCLEGGTGRTDSGAEGTTKFGRSSHRSQMSSSWAGRPENLQHNSGFEVPHAPIGEDKVSLRHSRAWTWSFPHTMASDKVILAWCGSHDWVAGGPLEQPSGTKFQDCILKSTVYSQDASWTSTRYLLGWLNTTRVETHQLQCAL
jgi:hypothetical protein